MQKINLAHVRARAASGGSIDYVVFEGRSRSGSNADNNALLQQLTVKARTAGLKVDQSALAFEQNGKIMFYGSKYLVDHLSESGLPRWTHKINA